MNESNRAPSVSFNGNEDNGGQIFWPYGPADPGAAVMPSSTPGLVNLSFIAGAIGRGKRIWLTMAVIGLLIGCGLFAATSSSYSASVSILLSEDPQGVIGGIATDTVLVKDPTMAAAVVKKLGLSMTPYAFLNTYSAAANVTSSTKLTNGIAILNSPVLVITATAKTATQATSEAKVIAAEFLKFRAQTLQGQENAADAATDKEVAADRAADAALQAKVSKVSAEPSSAAQKLQLSTLQSEEQTASSALTAAETNGGAAKAARQLTVSTMTSGTQILYSTPAALTHSRMLTALEFIGVPFVGFLMIGLAIVTIGSVTSNRLRRRDDIAAALGAPVGLSVSAYAGDNRRLSGASHADVQRIVGYLKSVLQEATRRPATLAIVAVDNAPAVVPLVKTLAASLVEERIRVAVADLSDGLLASETVEDKPGVHKVRMHGAGVILIVPETGKELEAGPLHGLGSGSEQRNPIATTYAGADVFLTATSLDPARGGDYIATWATEAVVVITAGASSAVKIQSAGEILRAAGIHVKSAIVLSADKDDDSLGAAVLT